MLKTSKRVFISFVFLSFTASMFSYSYKIVDENFDIGGITQESALRNEINIENGKIFEDEESLLLYINGLKQTILNTRNFEEVEITYSVGIPEDDICPVTLEIKTQDIFHFFILPYILFSTSDGLTIKTKMKDSNFLGTLKTLDSSIALKIKPDDDGNQFKIFEPEFNFTYDMPFKIGEYNFIWTNNHNISYTWGEKSPEWSLETGITWIQPLKRASLILSFTQGFYKNLFYQKSNDDLYLSEDLIFSVPIAIAHLANYKELNFTPFINFNLNSDPFKPNGYLGLSHKDLIGPIIETGCTFDHDNVNWNENFRNGISFSVGPTVSYNFASPINSEVTKMKIAVDATATAFKSLEVIGFNFRCKTFTCVTNEKQRFYGSENVDKYLRGIINDTRSNYNPEFYQADTPTALIFNFDMPIHILTTNWEAYKLTQKSKIMSYLNFEIQISPFIDLALIKTTDKHHGYSRTFNLKDGFYTTGVEILLYPLKWRSNIIRISAGFDIGSLLCGSLLDTSWRNKRNEGKAWYKTPELLIGLGLHY